MDWQPHIKATAEIMGGVPCIVGTRIPVSVVLDNLAAGLTGPELIAQYPTLSEPAIRAAIAYAAELTRERVVALPA